MRYLDADTTRVALPMLDAIEAMEQAFSGDSEAPLRSLVGSSLVMPGRLDDLMAVKVVSTVPGNPAGLVVAFDGEGTPLGIVDGPTLTAIRTGAGAGLATRLLAREDAATLAMLGAGAMAFDQVEAVRAVRPIREVRIWSRSYGNARGLADRIGGVAVDSADEAVRGADVISCATPSTRGLFAAASVSERAHVNAVGAFTPEMAELPPDLLERAYVVVDDVDAAAAEAGDLIQAGRHPDTTLRELLAGTAPEILEGVTVFKSVGVAAQDVAAAGRALRNAAAQGLGVDLG
ncbi:MAG TPA: ornithine cyclodeaminase family protein [Acidimicrobiia bacterium]|nr:ornithine cyclodeaminase family protein [Acidimicrobiia bacterium]